MKKNFKKALLIIAIVLPALSIAQCRSFIKKTCFPKIAPYTHNGQLNSAMLAPGQTAELQITFYSGQEYRLIVCSQESLKGVYFRLLDEKRKEVYTSATSSTPGMRDFKAETTQQLSVEIIVPKGKETTPGCVALLIGFKN